MTRATRQDGTSLIELLAAVAIFAVIAAGAGVATVSTLRGNATSRDVTAAAALIHDKIEQLRALDPAAAPADLRAGEHVDARNPLTALGATGGSYRRSWTVTVDSPRRGLSEVVVTVSWNNGTARTLRSATYVCRSATCT
jgi:prepilin-type N-terminal cleavage/methylation domain-containing protein